MSTFRISRTAGAYLAVALVIVCVAVVLGATRDIGVGWAAVALTGLFVIMVGHDARSRGLSVRWGIFALSLVGFLIYVSVARKRDGNVRY